LLNAIGLSRLAHFMDAAMAGRRHPCEQGFDHEPLPTDAGHWMTEHGEPAKFKVSDMPFQAFAALPDQHHRCKAEEQKLPAAAPSEAVGVNHTAQHFKQAWQHCLFMGNLNSLPDWGHARDYIKMQWRMLLQGIPNDFAIATGRREQGLMRTKLRI